MIMRIGLLGAVAHVSADTESELGVLVNHLAVRRALVEILAGKLLILEHIFHE
jgi:hypothetical protein